MEKKRKPPVPAPPLPAAVYARISSDREGERLGVETQEADCRALAERLGWEVVAVYVDNDISAYSGARRPQYEEMLKAVKSGAVKGLVLWHTDRLHRRLVELERFVSLAEAHHLQVQTVTAGEIDLTTTSGRTNARLHGVLAQNEVEHARDRMRRAKAKAATDGKYRGGPRPFGFDKHGIKILPAEAEIIRSATKAVLAGRSLTAVARELNETGRQAVRLVKRKNAPKDAKRDTKIVPWTYGRLRDVLVRPRNAGLLSTGRAARDEFEIVGKAKWDAIVDEDSWRAVHALLMDPSRRKQQGNDPRWLGAGIYTCGVPTGDGEVCGTPLRTAPYGPKRPPNDKRRYLYRCTAAAHLTIMTSKTDEFVRRVVAEMLRDPRVVAGLQPHDNPRVAADREKRTALASRLESFDSDYADGKTTATLHQKATAKVTAQLNEIDARLAAGAQRTAASPIMRARDPGAAFLSAPVDVQRAVLRSVLHVEVRPAAGKGAAWSSKRLAITPVT